MIKKELPQTHKSHLESISLRKSREFLKITYFLGRHEKREVSLMMKHGVEAKNYDDIAKAEKLKPLEVYFHEIHKSGLL